MSTPSETTTKPETSRQPADWREGRRLRAWELHQQGWTQQNIAHALGVTQGAVSQWLSRAKKEGREGLKTRPSPGAPARLSWELRAQIPRLLARGAESFGFAGDVWTRERIASVLEAELGVRYQATQITRLLKACGWSRQKPILRATQRNEAAIAEWQEERLPALKKGRTKASINSCL